MSFDSDFARFEPQLIDFWERRRNTPIHETTFTVFGRKIHFSANEEIVLQAAAYSQPLFSSAPALNDHEFKIEIVVRRFHPRPAPLPENLFDHIQYTGHGRWLSLHLGEWGHCHIDLAAGQSVAVLSLELGCNPEAISRYLLNTILTNFMFARGLGLLHATAVCRANRILIMIAGHNSGKSTTALHLALNGCAFISDSQVYIDHRPEGLRLYGFPVGRVKLRRDMLPHFPRLESFLQSEPVRRETKFRLDLHLVDPSLVYDDMIRPEKVVLCLLGRSGREKTTLSPAAKIEALETAVLNSLFYDSAAAWHKNFEQIKQLVQKASCYHLTVGTDPGHIVQVVGGLMS